MYGVLLDIPYDFENGKHSLVGLILSDTAYASSFGAGDTFPEPVRLAIYDETIANDATAVVRAKAEAKHRAKRADKGLYDAAKRETRQLIISKVEDTWIRELKDETTFYTQVSPRELLTHLQEICLGRHAIDAVSLLIR